MNNSRTEKLPINIKDQKDKNEIAFSPNGSV